jgi:hypothetical protein
VKFALSGDGGGEFIAPPLSWPSWTKIGIGYFGRSKTTLGFEAACDTGALAEVRYEIDVAGELAGSWVGACDWHDPAPYTVPATFSITTEDNGDVSGKYHSVNSNTTASLFVDDNSLQISMKLFGYDYQGNVKSDLHQFEISNKQLNVVCRFRR